MPASAVTANDHRGSVRGPIARLVQADEDTVRDVIQRFNEIGLACLDPRWAGGRPRLLSDDDEDFVIQTATTRPVKLGQPFTRWSVRKLSVHLRRNVARPIRNFKSIRAARNKVELCFTPINASWANPVEAHFGPLRQFTLANSNHPNHTVQTRALHHYLHWRNQNARHPGVLAAQRRERARVRSEKGIRWGSRPLHSAV
ncbi:helix-turn-helix domain-containing protein [Streptomyces olivochromogenes]|uniref:helix-turn-helix domain-containing protein n=1 Tax=Streptomyces olivochromogenes TaxID=1963 RepID=UPI0036DA9F6C